MNIERLGHEASKIDFGRTNRLRATLTSKLGNIVLVEMQQLAIKMKIGPIPVGGSDKVEPDWVDFVPIIDAVWGQKFSERVGEPPHATPIIEDHG